MNILIRDERDLSLNLEEKLEIHKILCNYLENPSLVWNSTQNISEQKNLKKKLEEFLNLFETKEIELNSNSNLNLNLNSNQYKLNLFNSNENEKKKLKFTFEKFTNLNLSLISLLKKSLEFHNKQIEILNEKEFKIEKKNILNLTDIELLNFKNKKKLLISILNYFNLNLFKKYLNLIEEDVEDVEDEDGYVDDEDKDGKEENLNSKNQLKEFEFEFEEELKIDLILNKNCKFHKNYSSKNQDKNQFCILFEILIENLFFSKSPKLILILIKKLSKNKKEDLNLISKRCLNWFNNIFISLNDLNLFLQQKDENEIKLNFDQLETLAQLNIWSKKVTNGIKIYLKLSMLSQIINL